MASTAKKESKYISSTKMLLAGGCAGAVARTATAPLDRMKLLFQVQALGQAGTTATSYTGIGQAFYKIYTEEGILAFWKGNGVNIIRIFPYSASQFMANDQFKRVLADENGKLTVTKRLISGALAGMTGTTLTHPLDTVRLRLALPNHPYKGPLDAVVKMVSTEGVLSLYKGLVPTLVGIAPYAATNFASYDLLKTAAYGSGYLKENWLNNLLVGAAAGTIATTLCYPLDTIRRRMQMQGIAYSSVWDALVRIPREEGFFRGFYKGWFANTLKVIPQNSIRFVAYEFFKKILGVVKQKTDT